jgi:hypothetical protein
MSQGRKAPGVSLKATGGSTPRHVRKCPTGYASSLKKNQAFQVFSERRKLVLKKANLPYDFGNSSEAELWADTAVVGGQQPRDICFWMCGICSGKAFCVLGRVLLRDGHDVVSRLVQSI